MNVNGIDAICLGHNYQEGILKHEYYGSQKIIDDLLLNMINNKIDTYSNVKEKNIKIPYPKRDISGGTNF